MPSILAEHKRLAQRQFRADVLGIWSVPDKPGAIFITFHRFVEQAQDIAGCIELQTGIFIGLLRNQGCAGRVVGHETGADIEVVLVGVPHKRVAGKSRVEVRVEIRQPDDLGLYRVELIEELSVTQRSRITVRCRDHIPRIFRTVLVVI